MGIHDFGVRNKLTERVTEQKQSTDVIFKFSGG